MRLRFDCNRSGVQMIAMLLSQRRDEPIYSSSLTLPTPPRGTWRAAHILSTRFGYRRLAAAARSRAASICAMVKGFDLPGGFARFHGGRLEGSTVFFMIAVGSDERNAHADCDAVLKPGKELSARRSSMR
jgi:hypothetical protein